METKNNIRRSLNIFSEKEYSDVYVNDIAKAVCIKTPSLYKHFKNKEEIFNAILLDLKESYTNQTSAIGINENNTLDDSNIYPELFT